ncbi:hypothetical protein [Novosphingobium sp.]|uniref:hypothetical protein n=1 Tax=Novosphingobium sp. TaxID=1874826 RepID=UPI0028B191AE|nr:hypothetical protein [Novosphingobium sp.]
MTRKEAALLRQRESALNTYLASRPVGVVAASLSRSYGLPLQQVETIMRRFGYA